MTDAPPPSPDADREAESAPSLTPPAASASELVGAALGEAAKRAGLDPAEGAPTGHVVWRAMGGWRGILESVLPSLVFVVLFTVTYDRETQTGNLWLSLGLSVGLAAIFTIIRLITKSPPSAAIGGLVATAGAAALALLTGRGRGQLRLRLHHERGVRLGVPRLRTDRLVADRPRGRVPDERGTALARRQAQAAGVLLAGDRMGGTVRFRLAVQLPLYFAGDVTALGTLKLIMGLPLFAPLVAVTWLAVRALYPARRRSDTFILTSR